MRFVNKTFWNTEDLRLLVRAIIKSEGLDLRDRYVEVVYNRTYGVSGVASLGKSKGYFGCSSGFNRKGFDAKVRDSYCVRIRVGKKDFDIDGFARVFIHELGHNQGLRHKDMLNIKDIVVPEHIKSIVVRKNEKK